MALWDLTDEEWFSRLNQKRLEQKWSGRKWWEYYDNEQPLAFVARILQEQEYRFPPLMIAWPELVIDSLEERLDVEGFRLGDDDEASEALHDIWQWNDLDEESEEAHLAALVTSTSYVMVGPAEPYPKITIEYGDEVAVEVDPGTRRVVAGLKVWSSDGKIDNRGTLMLPGRLIEFELGKPVGSQSSRWSPAAESPQASPLVPLLPMLNRARKSKGRSDLVAMRPLVDAANQTATNLLAAVEHHALPRKYAIGVSKKDFVDEEGRQLPTWKVGTGAVWAVPGRPAQRGETPPQIELGQFPASDLRNFIETIKLMAQTAASLYGLPQSYMGFVADNPASADSIRAAEARLIKRAERRQIRFGGTWERAMRIAWEMRGEGPAAATRLETVWRDPATPTRAARIDAATKALQSGLADDEQAREDAGYTAEQRRAMRRRAAENRNRISDDVRALDVTGVPDAASILGGAGGPVPRQPAAGVPS
ncbi:phage portal protein [Actinoalloteichus sp. GBA129-24]|uniref:phage portal protein n=1 Tax=Actinoalloteichus sp. GBA129-24 TaxID=1612551 RepID=UPI000950B649|nr:phage portal protein [Actinoalloteichus sp. GBA129-24]APU20939.1 Phage portal protein, SPP1 Gp6 [Actinoalloteichus sp. GBA129-24]APU24188.1 Phage portal protein, SPP1 Gp6 [Actinoalloteichus sp. GBA129-24]